MSEMQRDGSEMRCKRCGANECRIHGFCSVECEHYFDYEEEITDLEARIAELEALVERLIEAGNKLGTYFIGYTPRKKELLQREFWEAWRSAVSDWQSMTSHVTNPSDSQGIVTRNGGEG